MRKAILGILIVFAVSVLVLSFLIIKKSNLTELEKNYVVHPVEQISEERVWREINFTQNGTSESLTTPISMRYGPDGLLYVGDVNDLVVKIFNSKAELIDSLGLGEGRGPGEFLDLYVMLIDQKGKVWVNDRDNARITILDSSEEKKWEIITPKTVSAAAIPLDSGNYVLDQFVYGQLAKFSSDHKQTKIFEPFMRDPKPWIILLQGKYAIAHDNSILKSFIYTNNFIRYSKEGRIIYFRKPIQPPELADITRSPEANDIGVQENLYDFQSAKQFTSGINVVGDKIHLLISRNLEPKKGATGPNILKVKRDFVDVYSLETGDYLYTYRLPEAVSVFSVSEEYLAGFSAARGKLMVWKVEDRWE